jgi:DNA (cytosine-5)-methyltransferase 1
VIDHLGQHTLKAPPDGAVLAIRDVADELDAAFLRASQPAAPPSSSEPLALIDLFSGLGGMTIGAIEGARRAGRAAELVLAVDHEPGPLDVLGRTLGSHAMCRVADLESVLGAIARATSIWESELFAGVPAGGLLLAGPPCQGHSPLNNHTRHDDPRNDLYLAVARAARLTNPQAVIIENVRGVGNDRRNSVGLCVAALEELGYEVDGRMLDLHTVGAPQRRVRYVVVATRGEKISWDLPDLSGRTVRWAIEDLLDAEGSTAIDTPSRVSTQNVARIEWLFENRKYDLANSERPKCHQSEHSYVSMYGRLNWNKPAQTITSGFGSMGQGRFVHPSRRRTLTPHEAARLQFLPDYVDFGAIASRRSAVATMIGNVAPPKLTMTVVEALIRQGLL